MSDVAFLGDATSGIIGVTKRTLDRLLDNDDAEASRVQIVALYMFYCYTAKWQRTDQIHCTNNFAAQRLKLSGRTIARARAVLERMELVRSVSTRGADGKVSAWYIRVNYFQNVTDVTLVTTNQNAKSPECHPCHTNALVPDTDTKCLETNKGAGFEKKVPSNPMALRICQMFHRKPTTPWTPKEVRSFKAIAKQIEDEDLAMCERRYKKQWPPNRDKNCLRHEIFTFLNHYPGEVDRSRTWCEQNPVRGAKPLPPPIAKEVAEQPLDPDVNSEGHKRFLVMMAERKAARKQNGSTPEH